MQSQKELKNISKFQLETKMVGPDSDVALCSESYYITTS